MLFTSKEFCEQMNKFSCQVIFCLVVLVTANMSVSALTYSSSFESYIKLTINKASNKNLHHYVGELNLAVL